MFVESGLGSAGFAQKYQTFECTNSSEGSSAKLITVAQFWCTSLISVFYDTQLIIFLPSHPKPARLTHKLQNRTARLFHGLSYELAPFPMTPRFPCCVFFSGTLLLKRV